LSDEVEARIEALMDGDVAPKLANSPDLGRAERIDDVDARYIEYAKADYSTSGARLGEQGRPVCPSSQTLLTRASTNAWSPAPKRGPEKVGDGF
jgi:hypothetical protein